MRIGTVKVPFLLMGYRISTYYNNIKLVEELPEVFKQSIVTSIIGNKSISKELVNTALGSLYVKAKNAHLYAKTTYTHGLPEGTVGQAAIDPNDILTALCTDLGLLESDTRILNTEVYEFAIEEYVFQWLLENSNIPYLADLSSVIITLNGDLSGKTYTYYSSELVNSTTIKFSLKEVDPYVVKYRDFTIRLESDVSYTSLHYYITYTHLEETPLMWIYDAASKQYPDLETKQEIFGSNWYMPIIPIRVYNEDYFKDSRKNTELYKTSTKLLDKLGLKAQDIRESINANPSIDDIDHAYVSFAVNVDTKDEATIRYLWEFFYQLYTLSPNRKELVMDVWNNLDNYFNLYTVPNLGSIGFRIREHTYDFSYSYYYIDSYLTNKVIGKVGAISKSIVNTHKPQYGNVPNAGGWTLQSPNNGLYLYKQETETQCRVVFVSNLSQANDIEDAKVYYSDLMDNERLNEIIIPLNLDILKLLPFKLANQVCYDSFKIVINAYVKEKVKWYESGIFKLVVIVASAVISVAIGFADGGSLMSGIIAATTTMAGIAAVVVSVITNIFISIGLDFAFKLVDDLIPIEVMYLLAAAAFIYGAIEVAFDLGLPFATNLVSLATASTEQINTLAQEQILNEVNQFNQESSKQLEELYAKAEELGLNSTTFPMTELFMGIGMLPRESYDSFITRKTKVNYIDEMLESIPNFVNSKLYLPKGTNL